MRLNQAIQSTGYCSRREADTLISQGRVTLKGQTAVLGMQVDRIEDIRVDGQALVHAITPMLMMYHKPVGVVSTTEAHIQHNIIDAIGYPERIFPIGRLDKDSEGLILLTNQGNWVNPILRSENGHEKEYVVKVDRPYDDAFLSRMAQGVQIYNPVSDCQVVTLPCKVERIDEQRFSIILTQGLNRQIRRMVSACGHQVRALKRVRILHIRLGNLKKGEWRLLNDHEMKAFLDLFEKAKV